MTLVPNNADSSPQACALCGEPMDAAETAVAVRQMDGAPGLVHPACYPTYSAQQRAAGNADGSRSPLRDILPPGEQRIDGSV